MIKNDTVLSFQISYVSGNSVSSSVVVVLHTGGVETLCTLVWM